MTNHASEPYDSHWDWDMDGDEGWDNVVLTLLALAVVAATALALHWFGSGQDQEMTGSEPAAPYSQPPQARALESAPYPETKVSVGVEGPGRGTPGPPGCSQGGPVASGAQGWEPPSREGPAGTVGPAPQMPGEMVSRTARGQQHSGGTSEAPQDTGRQPPLPGTALPGRSKAGRTSSPVLIYFTPRDPGRDARGGARAVGPRQLAHQEPGHAAEQDTSPWKPGVGLPRRQGRGWGSKRQADTHPGDRPCRSPRRDLLWLGDVVSVWDTVDALAGTAATATPACRLLAGSQLPTPSQGSVPQELPALHAMQAEPLADVSEQGRGKSRSQPVPVPALGSGATAGGSGDTLGDLGSAFEEERNEVLFTRSFSMHPGSMEPSSSDGPCRGIPHSSPGQETLEASQVAKAREGGSRHAHSLLSPALGRTEKQVGHCLGERRESQQVAGSQAADLEPGQPLDRERPTPGLSSSVPSRTSSPSPLTTLPAGTPSEPPLSGPSPTAHHCGDHPHGASELPAASLPSDKVPHEVSQGPSQEKHFREAPAPTPTPTTIPAPTSTSPPTPVPTPTAAPVSSTTSAPVITLASAPSTTPVPAPALTPTPARAKTPTPTPTPTPSLAPIPALDPTITPVPTAIPAPDPQSPVPYPASWESSMTLSRGCQEDRVSGSWGNLIAMVLKSHPFPRQERPQGTVLRVASKDLADPGKRVSGRPSETVVPRLEERRGSPVGQAAGAGPEGLAEAPSQPQPGGYQTDRDPAPGQAPSPGGTRVEEKSGGSPLPQATEIRPTPWPRKRSPCEGAQRSGRDIGPAASEQRREGTQGQEARAAGREAPLTEKQKEARKLMVFLQRRGGWGVAEVPRQPGPQPAELPATVAALRRRLDLGSCLEVLAFAQQHGARGLAQDTYAVLSDNLLHVLADSRLYRQLSGAERERILSLRTGRGQAVLGVLVLPSLYQVGRLGFPGAQRDQEAPPAGSAPPSPAHLHVFSPRENAWRRLTQVPAEVPLRGCGLCTMHNYLFLAGGVRGSGPTAVCSNEVFCYNPLTSVWSRMRPMQQARAQLRLVALDGLLYAIGGECLYSMERYDPRTDSWASRASLPAGTFPVAHEAVACRGDIYVTGGHLFYRLLRYSPATDAWNECPYSASHRRSSDIVALGGFLYRFDLLRGVGAAVMRYNTVTGSWSRAASLPLPDPAPLRCAVLGNTIYCLNHQVTATFTVADATAQFEAKELQPCPVGSKGTLCPFILTLPPVRPLQTAL